MTIQLRKSKQTADLHVPFLAQDGVEAVDALAAARRQVHLVRRHVAVVLRLVLGRHVAELFAARGAHAFRDVAVEEAPEEARSAGALEHRPAGQGGRLGSQIL